MKGYTIQHSIDLLEKQVEVGGSGGSTTAESVSYDNTSSGLIADDVQEAIDELKGDIPGLAQYGANYSVTEHVVGTWLDGTTPVYEKTIDCGALPANTTKEVEHGITNLDLVISAIGMANRPGENYNSVTLPSVHSSAIGNQTSISVNLTKVVLANGNSGASAYTKSYVVLRYTKVQPTTNTRKKSSK